MVFLDAVRAPMNDTFFRSAILNLANLALAMAVGGFVQVVGVQAAENAKDDDNKNRLLIASVVDAASGEAIDRFIAVPGVGRLKDFGYRWQWQPHQIYEFTAGKLQWPPPGRRGYSMDQALRIEAEGYLPYVTPTIKHARKPGSRPQKELREQSPEPAEPLIVTPGQPAALIIRLRRDPGVGGRVVDAEGNPLSGATVAVGMGNFRSPHIRKGELYLGPKPKADEPLRVRWERPQHTKTDASGRFMLPSETQRSWIVVAHPYGVGTTSYENLIKGKEVQLQAWGRIEGRAEWNGRPAVGEKIRLFAKHHLSSAITDVQGRFSFDKVPPGEVGIGRDSVPAGKWNGIPTNPNGRVDVPPGESVQCVLGGRGRPIVGKVTGFKNWRNVKVSVHLNLRWPSNSFRRDDDPTLPAFYGFIASEIYKHYDKVPVSIEPDGAFRLDDVPAESYAVVVKEREGDDVIRQGESRFRINLLESGKSDQPQDVGAIEISPDGKVTSKKIQPLNFPAKFFPAKF